MFKFTVIMPITAKVETVLRLLGTYKIILKRKNHRNTMFQFYYIGDDFLVLRESGIKLKLLCTAWKIVQYDIVFGDLDNCIDLWWSKVDRRQDLN